METLGVRSPPLMVMTRVIATTATAAVPAAKRVREPALLLVPLVADVRSGLRPGAAGGGVPVRPGPEPTLCSMLS